MPAMTRQTDSKARVSLPQGFANATVIVDQVSETELRIRKAQVIPEDEIIFAEEKPILLSERGWKQFAEMLDNPPPPSPTLKRFLKKYGSKKS